MKTRIIHTKIWQDNWFFNLTGKEKLAYFYLITNSHINISGAFEMPDRFFCYETGLNPEDWEKAKNKFITDNRIRVYKNFIQIINIDKYNNYRFSEKNEKAYNKEVATLPDEVRRFFKLNFTMTEDEFREKRYIKHGSRYKHITIAEASIGRVLSENEVVHHLDKNPENNLPENLVIMDKKDHIAFHSGKKDLKDISMILVSDYYDTAYKSEIINNKSETINNKTEIIKQKPSKEFMEELRNKLKMDITNS